MLHQPMHDFGDDPIVDIVRSENGWSRPFVPARAHSPTQHASIESQQASRRGSGASRPVSRRGSSEGKALSDRFLQPPLGVLKFDTLQYEGEQEAFEETLWKLIQEFGKELTQLHQDDLRSHIASAEHLQQNNRNLKAELARLRRAYAHGHVLPPAASPTNLPVVPPDDASVVSEFIGVGEPNGGNQSVEVISLGKALVNGLKRILPLSAPSSARESLAAPASARESLSSRESQEKSIVPAEYEEDEHLGKHKSSVHFNEDVERLSLGAEVMEQSSISFSQAQSMPSIAGRMNAMQRAAMSGTAATMHDPPSDLNGRDSMLSDPTFVFGRASQESGIPIGHVETMFGVQPPEAKKKKGITFADQEAGPDIKGDFTVHPNWSSINRSSNHLKRHKTTKMLLEEQEKEEDEEDEEDSDTDDDMYKVPGERYLQRFIIKPNTYFFLVWATLGYVSLLYDAIVLPLGILSLEMPGTLDTLSWVIRIYWTLHIPMSLLLSFERINGESEKRLRKIVKRYLRGWFMADVVLAVIDWIEIVLTSLKEVGLGYVRLLRIVRLLRLMRARSMPLVVRKVVQGDDISATCFTVTQSLLFMMWFNHLCACVWFGIGTGGETGNTWIDLARDSGWNVDSTQSIYIHSYRWQLANFVGESGLNPKTELEYVFLLCTSITAFLVACMIVSSITSAMTRLEIAVAQDHKRFALLRQYLRENHISSKIAMRVTRNAQYQAALEKKRTPEQQIDLLNSVSEPLRIDLHFEINMKVLSVHPLHLVYSILSEKVMRQICHSAVSRLHIASGDILFHAEETAAVPYMYFVTEGKLSYYHQSGEFKPWTKGGWACEPVLWASSWIHYGTARARSECTLAMLQADQFQKFATLDTEENIAFMMKYCSSMVQELNETPPLRLTDLADPEIDLCWYVQKAIPGEVAKDVKKRILTQIGHVNRRPSSHWGKNAVFGKIFGHAQRGSLGSFNKQRALNRISTAFQSTFSVGSASMDSVAFLRDGHRKVELAANIVENHGSARRTRVAGVSVVEQLSGCEFRNSTASSVTTGSNGSPAGSDQSARSPNSGGSDEPLSSSSGSVELPLRLPRGPKDSLTGRR